ncbi:MAG: hypothetical protein ABIK45_11605 [Pseudomonadota bacterium]
MKHVIRLALILVVVAVVAALSPLPAKAQAGPDAAMSQPIGQVVALSGSVSAARPDGQSRLLDLDSQLFARDVLTTGLMSTVEVRFNDQTILAQGQQSTIVLDDYVFSDDPSASKLLFTMGVGTFRVLSGEIVKQNPDGFALNTPLTTIGIRGTEPFAVVTRTQETIGVLSIAPGHVVSVTSPTASVTMDRPGLSTSVGSDGSMSQPAPTSPEVQRNVINAAPMTTQGEPGAVGQSSDLDRRVQAFREQVNRTKSSIGGVDGRPDYGRLRQLSLQQSAQQSAESDRSSASSQAMGGGSDSGADSGGGHGQH